MGSCIPPGISEGKPIPKLLEIMLPGASVHGLASSLCLLEISPSRLTILFVSRKNSAMNLHDLLDIGFTLDFEIIG